MLLKMAYVQPGRSLHGRRPERYLEDEEYFRKMHPLALKRKGTRKRQLVIVVAAHVLHRLDDKRAFDRARFKLITEGQIHRGHHYFPYGEQHLHPEYLALVVKGENRALFFTQASARLCIWDARFEYYASRNPRVGLFPYHPYPYLKPTPWKNWRDIYMPRLKKWHLEVFEIQEFNVMRIVNEFAASVAPSKSDD